MAYVRDVAGNTILSPSQPVFSQGFSIKLRAMPFTFSQQIDIWGEAPDVYEFLFSIKEGKIPELVNGVLFFLT